MRAGGAKLIWFEATAIREDGRANPRQIAINEGNVDEYARLHEMMMRVHREEWGTTDDLLIPMQLTMSGRYSVPNKTIVYHNPLIDQKTDAAGLPGDQRRRTGAVGRRLRERHGTGPARRVHGGGHQGDARVSPFPTMGAKTREGRYGGSLENRTRFFRETYSARSGRSTASR